MKMLNKDDTFSATTAVRGEVVKATRTVKTTKDALTRYVVDWTFDFAGVKREEVLRLAAATCIITAQRLWRKAPDKLSDPWATRTFKVRDMLDAERTTADPLTRASGLVAKMTPDERKALMEELQRQVAAEGAEAPTPQA
jgi:hypothetical protein